MSNFWDKNTKPHFITKSYSYDDMIMDDDVRKFLKKHPEYSNDKLNIMLGICQNGAKK